MRKFIRLFSMVIVFIVMGSSLLGCGNTVDENAITIRYFVGGFGTSWLNESIEDFKKIHPELKFVLQEDSQLRTTASTYLKSGKNVPDIMMSQNLGWTEFVSRGWIESLEDVYNTEVDTSAGKSLVKDLIVDDYAKYPYMHRLAGQGDLRPWIVPWSVLTCSIAYNEDILLNTDRASTGVKWMAPPETVTELIEYISDINLKGEIAPFSWGGSSGINWLLFPQYVWWAQIQGVQTSQISGEGSWYDFWNFDAPDYENADVWKQTGIWKSLDILRQLLVDTSSSTWKNSISDVEGRDTTDAERLFVQGDAAMMFAGSWLENEMRGIIPEGFNMKMMQVPFADGAQINPETNKPYTINNANAGDVMFIPKDAKHKEIAKEFLAFLINEEQLLKFTKNTGMVRPFKYNPLELAPEHNWTDFQRSCFDLYYNSDFNLFEISNNESLIYTYKRPELFQEVTINTALYNLKRLTGKEIMIDGNVSVNYKSVYDRVTEEYPKWKSELGI